MHFTPLHPSAQWALCSVKRTGSHSPRTRGWQQPGGTEGPSRRSPSLHLCQLQTSEPSCPPQPRSGPFIFPLRPLQQPQTSPLLKQQNPVFPQRCLRRNWLYQKHSVCSLDLHSISSVMARGGDSISTCLGVFCSTRLWPVSPWPPRDVTSTIR